MVMDELLQAWNKGIRVVDATNCESLRVFVKCIFTTFDYPGTESIIQTQLFVFCFVFGLFLNYISPQTRRMQNQWSSGNGRLLWLRKVHSDWD
jgi:hypothetical protein